MPCSFSMMRLRRMSRLVRGCGCGEGEGSKGEAWRAIVMALNVDARDQVRWSNGRTGCVT